MEKMYVLCETVYVVCDFVLLEMIRYIFQENSKDRTSPQVSCLSCDTIYLWKEYVYLYLIWYLSSTLNSTWKIQA